MKAGSRGAIAAAMIVALGGCMEPLPVEGWEKAKDGSSVAIDGSLGFRCWDVDAGYDCLFVEVVGDGSSGPGAADVWIERDVRKALPQHWEDYEAGQGYQCFFAFGMMAEQIHKDGSEVEGHDFPYPAEAAYWSPERVAELRKAGLTGEDIEYFDCQSYMNVLLKGDISNLKSDKIIQPES
ncbi:MAG: hypothetical protein AAF687_01865 [Pseudomonadota bacterium]